MPHILRCQDLMIIDPVFRHNDGSMPSGSEGTSAKNLEAGIGRGLEFLRRSQLPSGEFKVYVSSDLNLQYDVCLTVHHFPPRLLLTGLASTTRPLWTF